MNPVYSAINMSKQYPSFTPPSAPIATPLVQLWLLRMLVPLGTHRSFVDRAGGFANDALAEAVGLGEWVDLADGAFDASAARSALRQLHADAEQQSVASAPCSAVLAMNIQRLADLGGDRPAVVAVS